MPLFNVRVTRSTDEEWVDLEIDVPTWEEAKRLGIADAISNQESYFGPPPEPEFYVAIMDDDDRNIFED